MQRLSSKIKIVFDRKSIWTAEMSEASAWSQKSCRLFVRKHDITDVHNHKNTKKTGKDKQAHSNVMRNLQHKSIWKKILNMTDNVRICKLEYVLRNIPSLVCPNVAEFI